MDSNWFDVIHEYLHKARFEKENKKDREQWALKAVKICEEHHIGDIYYVIRILVKWPKLLKRYLAICTSLKKDDLSAMLGRCVEQSLLESAQLLIGFTQQKNDYLQVELMLLPGRYNINKEIYNICQKEGYNDPHYDAMLKYKQISYDVKTIIQIDSDGNYVGYRHAYHLLLYGGKRKIELIQWLEKYCFHNKIFTPDCTFDAAKDWLGQPDMKYDDVVMHIESITISQ